MLSSKMPKAKEFRTWVTSKVLPSIRKTGSYSVESKYITRINKLNQKLKLIKNENKILKHNQKKTKFDKGGVIYIIREIDPTNKNLLKVGKSSDLNKRLHTYNTSVPDNMEILFTLKVTDPDAVEHCIKGFAKPYIYRKNKEYYECDLGEMKEIISKCSKLIKHEFYCDNCEQNMTSLNNLIDHAIKEHSLNKTDKIYMDFNTDQSGGTTKLDYKAMYLESKQKFLLESIINESDASDKEFISRFYEQSGGSEPEKDYEEKYFRMERKNNILSKITSKQHASETIAWLNSDD
jgi:hypothetical protein